MSVSTVKRLASELLGAGQNRVRMNPSEIKRVEEALTRQDVLALIQDKIVYAIPVQGRRRKEKRRRRGTGARRGAKTINQKEEWMVRIRAQRKYLVELVTKKELNPKFKRLIYGKIKSGIFKNKKSVYLYLKENNMLMKGE